ncbi:dnaJ homolog subfamily C member 4 [Pantherophis guttatus]|uniref:DnaJ homolog subfamily C member 4 n=1 Tax=Pantherophis guttatus TaxID=94885 RepID=A0A6P9CNX1_PANGU|nr:dnaJ homolog subfamily C member 4 [Pantherophis guttatus]XP_034284897.1 dnaJ homolog subfamily C member 4 [Pantherophis guttatus]
MALTNLCFLCRCCQRCQNSRHRAFTSAIYSWSSARHISHYEVLGIKQDATSKEIKQAFFKKSKQLHPDSNPTNPELHSQFVKLNEAYNTLSKEKSRRVYDAQQTIQKTRDPFGDLHIHRQPRNQKSWEHQSSSRRSSEDPFNSDHFQETGRNPGWDPYWDDAYWQEFHKTPPEWYANHEFRRRNQRNLRIVMYCLLIMSGSLLVHFVSYRQVAKLHTSFMDEKDRIITQALIKAKEQARARHEDHLRQKGTPILEKDATSSKPHSEILDSIKDTVPPVTTAK